MTSETKHNFWQQHIAGWRQSKLSQKTYCTQQRLELCQLRLLAHPIESQYRNTREIHSDKHHWDIDLGECVSTRRASSGIPYPCIGRGITGDCSFCTGCVLMLRLGNHQLATNRNSA
ncbi:MAG: hypothetical protein L3J84_12575 [Gammaproteobacteria bacterium]|nr:hypothetical protein [Gammaproteobacteria bacterium]